MRVKLLIATIDILYAKLISENISENYADAIDVSVCSALEGAQEILSKRKYNVALMDMEMIKQLDTSMIHLPILLWSENEENEDTADLPPDFERIKKHQRISSIVSTILERYSKVSGSRHGLGSGQAKITAVWSPAGGVGKTTVAMAYALSNTYEGRDVFYLNLENFSSVPGLFSEKGKSISCIFEMLESHEGDVKMLTQGISCRDSGITYLCGPDNFDDMCILSSENVRELIAACAELADELVIDLSCICDIRTKESFDIADKVLIVMDSTIVSEVKLAQFMSQNNVFESIKEKVLFIANKGASAKESFSDSIVFLPFVQSDDTAAIFKVLSKEELRDI